MVGRALRVVGAPRGPVPWYLRLPCLPAAAPIAGPPGPNLWGGRDLARRGVANLSSFLLRAMT